MHLNSTKLITETVLKTHIGTVSFFQDKILGSLSCVSERMSSNPDVSPKVERKKYHILTNSCVLMFVSLMEN